jgi:hypothetical protein
MFLFGASCLFNVQEVNGAGVSKFKATASTKWVEPQFRLYSGTTQEEMFEMIKQGRRLDMNSNARRRRRR